MLSLNITEEITHDKLFYRNKIIDNLVYAQNNGGMHNAFDIYYMRKSNNKLIEENENCDCCMCCNTTDNKNINKFKDFKYNNTTYCITSNGVLYDKITKQKIGFWNNFNETIKYTDNFIWCPAEVTKCNSDGTFSVTLDDDDKPIARPVTRSELRLIGGAATSSEIEQGSCVEYKAYVSEEEKCECGCECSCHCEEEGIEYERINCERIEYMNIISGVLQSFNIYIYCSYTNTILCTMRCNQSHDKIQDATLNWFTDHNVTITTNNIFPKNDNIPTFTINCEGLSIKLIISPDGEILECSKQRGDTALKGNYHPLSQETIKLIKNTLGQAKKYINPHIYLDYLMTRDTNIIEVETKEPPANVTIEITEIKDEPLPAIDLSEEEEDPSSDDTPTTHLRDNLIWLEQETKINNALAIAEEARARTVALNMAISSIKDLTSTVKSLKDEVENLKTETATVKQTNELLMQKRNWLTDEDKENIRPKVIEIIVNAFVNNYIERGNFTMTADKLYNNNDMKEMKKIIDIISNVIINFSRNENECIRIANKIQTMGINCTKNIASVVSAIEARFIIGQNPKTNYLLFYDYKIIYFAFYEALHYYIHNIAPPVESNKRRYKSIDDGGLVHE